MDTFFTGVKPRLEFSIGIDIFLLDMLSCIVIYSEFLKEHSSVYEHVVGQQGIESSRVCSEIPFPFDLCYLRTIVEKRKTIVRISCHEATHLPVPNYVL